MQSHLMICVVLGSLVSCTAPSPDRIEPPGADRETSTAGEPDDAARLFAHASALASSGDAAGTLDSLARSFNAGYPTPSDVLRSDDFRPLLDDPAWRPQTRDLLKAHAREHSVTIVRPDEPGEPMILTVRLVDGHREPPEAVEPPVRRAGTVIGLVQVDAAGYYQPWAEEQNWNPRLFGFALTGEDGAVVIHTRRPGYYAPEYEAPDEPRHVHYNVERHGVLLRASEFYFEDDPRLAGDVLEQAKANRVPIASVQRDDEGVWHADVTIPVRGLR